MGGAGKEQKGKRDVSLQAAPQQAPSSQLVGEAIVASLSGVSVTVRWFGRQSVEQYYAARPGLTPPLPPDIWQETTPLVFFLRFRNLTREDVQFDPAMVSLVTQDGIRERPIPYEELYMRLAETEDSEARLRSLQATLLSRFVMIPPNGQREGILLFPVVHPKAKLLNLELGSFFVGGRNVPGTFRFQVIR
jgi:hypothetical protein